MQLVSLLIAASVSTGVQPNAKAPSAAALRAAIHEKGAKQVVDRLSRAGPPGQTEWDALLEQIGAGKPEFVSLAPELALGTDASTSETLLIALAYALPRAPNDVLRVLRLSEGRALDIKWVCGAPFIEVTAKQVVAQVKAARAALEKVSAPELQEIRSACLEQLTRAEAL